MEKKRGWADYQDRLTVVVLSQHCVCMCVWVCVCVCVKRRGCSDALVVWSVELWANELSH